MGYGKDSWLDIYNLSLQLSFIQRADKLGSFVCFHCKSFVATNIKNHTTKIWQWALLFINTQKKGKFGGGKSQHCHIIAARLALFVTRINNKQYILMPRFYCVNCGKDFASVRDMIMSPCQKHPLGSFKGNHILYEGSEKSQYTCKYCGKKFSSIRNMTWSPCQYHPKGAFKGNHSPAL